MVLPRLNYFGSCGSWTWLLAYIKFMNKLGNGSHSQGWCSLITISLYIFAQLLVTIQYFDPKFSTRKLYHLLIKLQFCLCRTIPSFIIKNSRHFKIYSCFVLSTHMSIIWIKKQRSRHFDDHTSFPSSTIYGKWLKYLYLYRWHKYY